MHQDLSNHLTSWNYFQKSYSKFRCRVELQDIFKEEVVGKGNCGGSGGSSPTGSPAFETCLACKYIPKADEIAR